MLFRKREPLHRRLAREGGLEQRPPHDTAPPGWVETGIHGVHRPREWDAVVAVDAPAAAGEEARFAVLPDGTLAAEEGAAAAVLAGALEGTLEPPYRAEAVRRGETQWAVGLRRIEVVELGEDVEGRELTLTVRDGERALVVDGAERQGGFTELERLGEERAESFVVEATRLAGSLWEIRVVPL